jgi:hypothetical protein
MVADFSGPINTGNLPTVITSSGLTPTPPLDLRAMLVQIVGLTNPGYTANLPGTLIEDIASTDTQAMVLIDQARVEALNSLTPYGCNEFVLMLLGKVYGVQIGQPVNTQVFIQFTGLPGFIVGKGFVVSDGIYQYVVQDGGVVGSAAPGSPFGQTLPLYCVSNLAGTWAVPAGTVSLLITPPPAGYQLSAINPEPGIPSSTAENATSYRTRVLRAGLAASQGMARYLRTLLSNVPGVQDRLIGIQQQPAGGWMIMVGGGDPIQVAYAIYQALFDISELVGSAIHILGITQANPAVVSTDLNHGYVAGNDMTIAGSNPATYNGNYAVLTVPSEKTFTLGKRFSADQLTALTWAAGVATATFLSNHGVTPGSTFALALSTPAGWNGTFVATTATGVTITFPLAANPGAATVLGQLQAGIANFSSVALAPYVSGGICTPNVRNLSVSIVDYPDSYLINYVIPPLQEVTCTVHWNTNSPYFVSPVAVSQLAAPALADYINSINVGAPINLLQMQDAFQNAIIAVLPPSFISVLTFQVAINGIGTLPDPGSVIIEGDPQSFFAAEAADFTITQV